MIECIWAEEADPARGELPAQEPGHEHRQRFEANIGAIFEQLKKIKKLYIYSDAKTAAIIQALENFETHEGSKPSGQRRLQLETAI
jgi:hypothetical protein